MAKLGRVAYGVKLLLVGKFLFLRGVHDEKKLVGMRKSIGLKDILVFIKVVVVFTGLGTAHYVGFISVLPSEVIGVVSFKFLPSFVSLFVFYFLFGFYAAKVFAFSFSQFYYCVVAPFFVCLIGLAGSRWLGRKRFARRIYRESRNSERIVYWMIFLSIILSVISVLYIRLDSTLIGPQVKVFAGSLVLAAFLKTGFLNRPKTQFQRIFDEKRVALRKKLAREYVAFFSSVLVLFAFYSGVLRCEMLLGESVVYFDNGKYNGTANILLGAGDEFLLADGEFYVYSSGQFLVKIPKK